MNSTYLKCGKHQSEPPYTEYEVMKELAVLKKMSLQRQAQAFGAPKMLHDKRLTSSQPNCAVSRGLPCSMKNLMAVIYTQEIANSGQSHYEILKACLKPQQDAAALQEIDKTPMPQLKSEETSGDANQQLQPLKKPCFTNKTQLQPKNQKRQMTSGTKARKGRNVCPCMCELNCLKVKAEMSLKARKKFVKSTPAAAKQVMPPKKQTAVKTVIKQKEVQNTIKKKPSAEAAKIPQGKSARKNSCSGEKGSVR